MSPGDVWVMQDGSRRLVLSCLTYNASALGRVITAVIGPAGPGFDPFRVDTAHGVVAADRIAMHPQKWLLSRVGAIEPRELAVIRQHLQFVLVEA
jgi:hypothetical protein